MMFRQKCSRIRTYWWEYCQNCSCRVEVINATNPEEAGIWCEVCQTTTILDITAQHRPE